MTSLVTTGIAIFVEDSTQNWIAHNMSLYVRLNQLIVVNKWHAVFVWTKHSKTIITGVLYVKKFVIM
jgi:hypothetical protein